MELIQIAPIDSQKILRKLAIAFSSTDVDRYFSLIQALDDLRAYFNKDILVELYGEMANGVEDKIKEFRYYVSIVESYHLGLDSKIIDKEDYNSLKFKYMQNALINLDSGYYYVTKVLSDLLKKTEIKNRTIPSSYWAQIIVDKKKMYPESPRGIPQEGREQISEGGEENES